jgi:REP element-mobilizing transposase RayT
MGRKYIICNDQYFYFVTFTVVEWLDIFTKEACREIFIDSVLYCQKEKGLLVGAWCMMTNHIHMIIAAENPEKLTDIIRDLKSYTSRQIRKHLEYSKSERLKDKFMKYDRTLLVADVRRKEAHKPNRHGKASAKVAKSYR